MKLIKSLITIIAVTSFSLAGQAQHYGSEYNESLKVFLSQSKILRPKSSLKEYISAMGPLLNAEIQADLKKEIGPNLHQRAPRIQVNALPYLGFDIISEGQTDRLEFVGSNQVFMTLNGQAISWEEARQWPKLKNRLQQILVTQKAPSFSFWSLILPEARANQLARPLIYGAAAVLTAGVFGYFLYKAADRVSKSKTQHEVEVTGVPKEVTTKIDVEGIPSGFDFNTNHELGLKSLSSDNLKDLVGLRTSTPELQSPTLTAPQSLPSQAVR